MTITCPHRHVSYASWRYYVFRQLLASVLDSHKTTPALPKPRLRDRGRHISNSTRPQTHDSRSPPNQSINTKHKSSNDAPDERPDHGGLPYPGASDGWDARQAGALVAPGDFTRHASNLSNDFSQSKMELDLPGCQIEQNTFGGSDDRKERPSKGQRRKKRWSPHDSKGKEDLTDLIGSLQGTLESSVSTEDAPREISTSQKLSERLPQSPLVQALERKKPRKLQTKDDHGLSKNPWAKMLASPMRYCSVTGVRIPQGLLVPWSLVKNPSTQDVYFMPADLAEVDRLKDKRGRSKTPNSTTVPPVNQERYATVDDTTRPTDSRAPTNTPTWDEKGSKKDIAPSASMPFLPKVYMLPLLLVLQHLTLNLTYMSKSGERRSNLNAINKMVPWRWNQALERASFYAERRRIAAGIPPPTRGGKASTLLSDFKHVKWDPEIDEIMLRILRERVLAALKALGKRNQKLWNQGQELVRAVRVASDVNTMLKLSRDKSRSEGSMNHSDESHYRHPTIGLLIEPGRYADPSRGAVDPMFDIDEIDKPASAFEPPSLQIDNSTPVPIFPLTELFDQDYHSRLQDLTTTLGVLAPRSSADGSSHAYVLVIPATAFAADMVFEEIWRLWRFVGGRMNTSQLGVLRNGSNGGAETLDRELEGFARYGVED